jgi:hypothetical protein
VVIETDKGTLDKPIGVLSQVETNALETFLNGLFRRA